MEKRLKDDAVKVLYSICKQIWTHENMAEGFAVCIWSKSIKGLPKRSYQELENGPEMVETKLSGSH